MSVFVEQGGLDRALGHEGLDRRAAQRGDPVEFRAPQVVLIRALVIIPQSPTTAMRVSPKRSLSFFTWLARVAGLKGPSA
jgi:hypothetical protein